MKLSRLSTVAAAAYAILLAAAARASAATGEQTPLNLDGAQPARGAAPGAGGGMMRTFIGLAVVVAVIYGLYWILKQVKSSREERASGSALSSLATLPLGSGRSLHMVRAGSEVVLVGVGEHGVTPIRNYAEPEARAAGLLDGIAGESDDGWKGLPAADGLNGHPAADGWDGIAAADGVPAVAERANGRAGAPSARAVVEALRRRTVRR